MNIWHYLLLIIAKFIVDSNQCNSNALKCYECKICQSGVDAMCGEKHNFKVCKCRKGELGDLKTCENTEGHASCVTAYYANGTGIKNRYCQVLPSSCLIPRPKVKCVSFFQYFNSNCSNLLDTRKSPLRGPS